MPVSGTIEAELEFQLKDAVPPLWASVKVATQVPVIESAGVPSAIVPVPLNVIVFAPTAGSVKLLSVNVKPPTDQSGLVVGTGSAGGLICSGLYIETGVF